jgi:hypothetical protein
MFLLQSSISLVSEPDQISLQEFKQVDMLRGIFLFTSEARGMLGWKVCPLGELCLYIFHCMLIRLNELKESEKVN